jgi:hypothetical protein
MILNKGANFMNCSSKSSFMGQSDRAIYCTVLPFTHLGSQELKEWAPLKNKISGLRSQWKNLRLFDILYQLKRFSC